LSAAVVSVGGTNFTLLTVKLSGTPTAATTAELGAVVIPAAHLVNATSGLTAPSSASVKFDIAGSGGATPTPTTTEGTPTPTITEGTPTPYPTSGPIFSGGGYSIPSATPVPTPSPGEETTGEPGTFEENPEVTGTVWESPFTDVGQSDWFFRNVEYAVEKGLFFGTSQSTFSPNDTMTRAMLVTVLWRIAGSPQTTGSGKFSDVENGLWYSDAVAWANENGIVSGYDNGAFGPDDSITREQMAAILHRYQNSSGKVPPEEYNAAAFGDSHIISGYAGNAVSVLSKQGIVMGKPGNLFDPKGTATRAEVAAVLHRYLEKVL